jgi:hypothetical protein
MDIALTCLRPNREEDVTQESPAAEPGDRLDPTRTCVWVTDGNWQGFVEFRLPSGSPELCVALTLRPSFRGSKDTISTRDTRRAPLFIRRR